MRHRRIGGTVLTALAATALVACGGGDEDDDSSGSEPATASTALP